MKKIGILVIVVITILSIISENSLAQTAPVMPGFLVKTNTSTVFMDINGETSDFLPTYGMIEVYEDKVCMLWNGISIYDFLGNLIKTITIPAEVEYYLDFVVLPDLNFALLDNVNDKIYFIDYDGNYITTINILEVADAHAQNLDGLVVDNSLIFSENGNNQILKIDLATYEVSIFRDLNNLEGWLGAIDNSGQYFICQARNIYSFMEGQSENLVCTLPEGNITGIVVFNSYAYVTINFSGRIYKVNLSTGNFEIFSEYLSYPQDIEGINLSLVVTNTNDIGMGSLRDAINYANDHPGHDNIIFRIPEIGPHTIQPLTALPTIYEPVIIDGYSQPGAEVASELPGSIATLLIELDGINLFDQNNVSGLNNTAGNSTVRGLAINRFGDAGIHIEGAGGNIIEGNYIGTDINGTADRGNFNHGVRIWNSPNNTIGGETQSARNLISGNNLIGIDIQQIGSIGNQVIGNYIGVDISGDINLANNDDGIRISEQANNNTIGPNNVISGNGSDGIEITGIGTGGNEILRNRIGTNAGGYYALGNSLNGIHLIQSANNTIERNVVSANGDVGILINGNSASGNLVVFNYIGTDWSGFDALLPNIDDGIRIVDAPNNIIGGDTPSTANIIAGNGDMGIEIAGSGSTGNHILGNYIGIGLGGEEIGNQGHGVFISASNNIIGGSTEGSGNVISNNQGSGIEITTSGASGNQILGNYIGTDGQGLSAKSNNLNGLTINDGASDNIIGNGNLISGNTHIGIEILSLETTGNEVVGNFIGTIEGGNGPLPNGENGVVIGDGASENFVGPNNLISGNGHAGVYIHGEFSTDNQVIENLIGTNLSGTGLVSNHDDGVNIFNASGTIIRGNVLCGAGVGYIGNNGVEIYGSSASGNRVVENFIGTNASSTPNLGNAFQGIQIKRDAHDNIIGPGNVISGNLNNGILIEGEEGSSADNNIVIGNYIGTNVEGTGSLGNGGDGIKIIDEASGNIIGGSTWQERNVISGNGVTGMSIYNNASENIIIGNYIGLDATGTNNIGHPGGTGIYFGGGAHDNLVGGSTPGSANFIAGNTGWAGVALDGLGTENNLVQGNFIGVNINGDEGFGNRAGIQIYDGASNNQIGGMDEAEGNLIAYNGTEGIVIYNRPVIEDATTGNLILSNAIHSNGNLGVDLGALFNEGGYYTSGDGVTENDDGDRDESPNNLQNYPVLGSIGFSPGTVTVEGYLNSTPSTDFILQFFASKLVDNTNFGEGQTYLGSETVHTDANGDVSFSSTFSIQGTSGQVITATATDPFGNSSEFSEAFGGVKNHLIAAMSEQPFHFIVNENGVPNISSGDDITAVENAFQAWTDIPTADIQFVSDGTTSVQNASATDGMNLVTFRDEQFPFAPGVLAIAAKTLEVEPGSEVAYIVDADIVFNPFYVNHTEYNLGIEDGGPTEMGFFDIQSVTTHEIGHVLGLVHTGVPTATMFFMMNAGTEYRTLETDDIAWASNRYPGPGYSTAYSSISGKVTYGDIGEISNPPQPDDHPPVTGALVLAINTATQDKIHAYTDANGGYQVPVAAGEEYWIYIEPLDGSVLVDENTNPGGFPLRPGNISSYIYSNTIYTDYPNEWYNGNDEGAIETTPENATEITVATVPIENINLVTNKDAVKPWVISDNTPEPPGSLGVTDPIIITFSEAIDLNSITDDNFYMTYELEAGNMINVHGNTQYLGEMTEMILFSPNEALNNATIFTLNIKATESGVTGITDLKGNVLKNTYTSTFTTEDGDDIRPVITDVIPDDVAENIFVTSEIMVFFSEPMTRVSTEQGVTVTTSGNLNVEGAFTWNPENTLLTFTPLQSLLEGEDYTVSLSTDIADLAGNNLLELADCTFTTVAEANPLITYLAPVDPAVGTVNATVETPVVVDFSEPINPSTISYSTYNLKSGNSLVPGTYEFLQNNSRVVFRPDADLSFGTSYTINLTTGIFDVSETPLALESNTTATFTTAVSPSVPHINYLDPPSGVVGSVISIAGSGFDPVPANNTVIFNGTPAAVTNASLSNLAVKVPLGATSGPVTVSVGGEASSDMFFYVMSQTLDPCEEILANINAGSRSRDVAVLPEAGLAYVTNPGSNNVSVIPLNVSNPEISNILVGNTPMKIDINPQKTLAYVTNFTSHTVSVIDLQDLDDNGEPDFINTIHVGVNPFGVVVSSDGKVYISNYTSENVSVIDVDPTSGGFNHVIANINTGTRNRDIDVTPEAALVLIAGDDGLNIIDVNPASVNFNTIIANVNSGTRTRDVAVHPEAGLAFVTTEEGALFVVDIYPSSESFGNVIANLNSTTARDVRVSPEAMFVYVTNEDGTVSVLKLDYSGVTNADVNVVPDPNATYYWNITLSEHATINFKEDSRYSDVKELEGLILDPDAEKLIVVSPTSDEGPGQIVVVSICCGPVSPLKSIGDMIIAIQNMINNGTINDGNGNALVAKLENALAKLGKDQIKPAINSLNSFINQVTAFWNSDKIPGEQASALIDATYAIIEQLENLPKKSYVLDVDDIYDNDAPTGFIGEIYPNPFNASTTIHYKIDDDQGEDIKVMVRVFNSAGQLIQTLVNQTMAPGEYITEWKGKLEDGSRAPDAVYVIELRAGDQKFVRKVILQRR